MNKINIADMLVLAILYVAILPTLLAKDLCIKFNGTLHGEQIEPFSVQKSIEKEKI